MEADRQRLQTWNLSDGYDLTGLRCWRWKRPLRPQLRFPPSAVHGGHLVALLGCCSLGIYSYIFNAIKKMAISPQKVMAVQEQRRGGGALTPQPEQKCRRPESCRGQPITTPGRRLTLHISHGALRTLPREEYAFTKEEESNTTTA